MGTPLTLQSSSILGDWKEAKKKWLSDVILSAEEKEFVKTSSLEEILADTNQADQLHGAFSNSRKLATRLKSLIIGIEQYGKALDVIAGAAPKILAPLWGGIRILLHVGSLGSRIVLVELTSRYLACWRVRQVF